MIFALFYGMRLFSIFLVIVALLSIIIYFSKNRRKTKSIIFGSILILIIFFFYVWFPVVENQNMNINNSIVETNYDAAIPEVYYTIDGKYLDRLSKKDDNWIGYIPNAEESFENIFDARRENVLMSEKGMAEYEKRLNSYSGYFIINSKEEMYNLTEEQVKEKLKLKEIKLGTPQIVIRKYGKDKDLSTFYKIIKDYFLPFSNSEKWGIKEFQIIKFFSIILFISLFFKNFKLKKWNNTR